jgi:transposase-like protein
MSETITEERAATKGEHWQERIAEQERSGMSIPRFCKDHGVAEHAFYYWRKRLREQQQPMRFALVKTGRGAQQPAREASLELVLGTGERLRIGAGVDATTLRMVLEALRA